jgi:hypothetical protein
LFLVDILAHGEVAQPERPPGVGTVTIADAPIDELRDC